MDKYGITKARYRELYNWCLQYKEWRDKLKYQTDSVKAQEITGMPFWSGITNSTLSLAMKKIFLQKECELLEQSIIEAVATIWKEDNVEGNLERMFSLMTTAVTEDYRYTYMYQVLEIPCSREEFNNIRRYFYYILSEKKSQCY